MISKRLMLAIVFIAMIACQRADEYRVEMESTARVTEATALKISKEALRRAGHDVNKCRPERYSNDPNVQEPFFARNEERPNNGYVLWRAEDDRSYTVHLEQTEGAMLCKVVRSK